MFILSHKVIKVSYAVIFMFNFSDLKQMAEQTEETHTVFCRNYFIICVSPNRWGGSTAELLCYWAYKKPWTDGDCKPPQIAWDWVCWAWLRYVKRLNIWDLELCPNLTKAQCFFLSLSVFHVLRTRMVFFCPHPLLPSTDEITQFFGTHTDFRVKISLIHN